MKSKDNNVVQLDNVVFKWPSGKSTDSHPIIDIEQLTIKSTESVFIKGESGSGKSTLLSLLTGINQPQAGHIKVLDQDINTLSSAKRDKFRADHLGYIFQMFNLLPYLSVIDNVTISCEFSQYRKAKALKNSDSLVTEATRLLIALGLNEAIIQKPVNELSIGQQQRVAAARALIGSPDIIIADEPTSALDFTAREAFIKLLFNECQKGQTTLIFVSHDPTLEHLFSRTIPLADINGAQ